MVHTDRADRGGCRGLLEEALLAIPGWRCTRDEAGEAAERALKDARGTAERPGSSWSSWSRLIRISLAEIYDIRLRRAEQVLCGAATRAGVESLAGLGDALTRKLERLVPCSRHEAEDGAQQAIRKAQAETLGGKAIRKPWGWLCKVGQRYVVKSREKRQNEANREEVVARQREPLASLLTETVAREDVELFRAALGELPDVYRDLLRRRLAGESTVAIAAEYQRTPATIRQWLRKAIELLRARFGV